ncbi:MAG: Tn3 family transposase [Pseudomonadales bacterium]|nr:Tn3 family transposase [Pseudomonadales bacterium]
MPLLSILEPKEAKRFDSPPAYTKQERLVNFQLPPALKRSVSHMKEDVSKVCFLIQYAYFKTNARFYSQAKFRKRDITYACNLVGCNEVDISTYNSKTCNKHRIKLLEYRGWRQFNENHRPILVAFAEKQASHQSEPRLILKGLVDLCWDNQITVPSYELLTKIITEAFNTTEHALLSRIDQALSGAHRQKLNALLDPGHLSGNRRMPPITSFKKIEQSIKPGKVAESIKAAQIFKEYYGGLEIVYDSADLSDQATRFYAKWLEKADYQQITQFRDTTKSYLYVLAFIKDQCFQRQDALVKTFIKTVTAAIHSIKSKLKEHEESTKKERNEALQKLNDSHKSYMSFAKAVIDVVGSQHSGPNEKYYRIEELVHEFGGISKEDEERLNELDEYLSKESRNQAYYDLMDKEAARLQRRVSRIISFLTFDRETSESNLIDAIEYLSETDFEVFDDAPVDFLSGPELKVVFRNGEILPSLYRSLLYFEMAKAFKGGRLNLAHSYEYRAIQSYLLDENYWAKNRHDILKQTGLHHFADGDQYLETLKETLHEKYDSVNSRINETGNEYFYLNRHGQPSIRTPSIDTKDKEFISDALSASGYIPILDVLWEVNSATRFTDCLKHHSNKNVKMKPKEEVFLAGIIGKGCNIGISKLSKISTGIKEHLLHNAVNWHFSLENLHEVNNKLVETIGHLGLANNYLARPAILHSSSDGRKVNVSVDALHANYSFKYFGKDQGVTLYTFIDERQAIFHSTVFSASDREAAYVLDGLMNNNVTPNQIHSTDTHGYTEKIFGASHMLGVDFAPRLKDLSRQRIYAFSAKKTFKKKGYVLLPSRTIKRNLILKNWDDILRFMATIKMRHSTASQLFKRLSSYSSNHPLYEALQEFGRIIKSQFILAYYDDVALRQQIQKQLNRVELSNKFSHAVFFDNDQEFQDGEVEDQQLSAVCQTIIQNSIILWNYMYLSKMVLEAKDKEQKQQIIDSVSHGSVITWKHVNLRGEYNFTRKAANDALFDFQRIKALRV